MGNFDFNQKISSTLALVFILILGFLVAWFSLAAGANIVNNAPNSKIFNAEKVAKEEMLRK